MRNRQQQVNYPGSKKNNRQQGIYKSAGAKHMIGNKNDLITFLAAQAPDKVYELKAHKKKRSLTQNSYYWELVGKYAQKCAKDGITAPIIHNMNLRALGLLEEIGGNHVFIEIRDTDEAENAALTSTTIHLLPTSHVKTNKKGATFRTYLMMRGSHTFNSAEMTALLEIMISLAKDQDIEVMTPAQLADLKRLETEGKNEGKAKRNNNS